MKSYDMKRFLHAICHRGMAFAVFIGLGLSVGAQPSVLHFVDPMIGSEGEGRVFPGPSMPYGMRPLQNSSYNLSSLNIFCTFIV